jgi:hypothetical protein
MTFHTNLSILRGRYIFCHEDIFGEFISWARQCAVGEFEW